MANCISCIELRLENKALRATVLRTEKVVDDLSTKCIALEEARLAFEKLNAILRVDLCCARAKVGEL